jgi:voltage-gated potassium channel
MRRRIYEIIEQATEEDLASRVYDIFMMIMIIGSLVPLAFKEEPYYFTLLDRVAVAIFMLDYFFRWITADIKFGKTDIISFLKYPFTPMAIVDLVSILPSLTILNSSFKALRVLRLMRSFRVFRVFKIVRYSKNMQIISNVLKNSKDALLAVCTLAVGYILISALIILNVEPESFNSFFDAVYWATISLTTMGYGDIYPVTTFGRMVTMLSSVVGIAIVALPAGIITAGYMKEISDEDDEDNEVVNEINNKNNDNKKDNEDRE